MKRLFVLTVSCGVFAMDAIRDFCVRLVGKRPGGRCAALMYHEVSAPQRQRFARQMDLALGRATALSPDSAEALEPGRKYFVVTFDDGPRSVADHAVPALEERHIPAAVFVVTGVLGTVPAWRTDAPRGSWARVGRSTEIMLSGDEVRRISGRILVGSHSVTHPKFSEIGATQARYELEESRRQLSALLGHEVTLFSFPYGESSESLVALCREAGYQRVFTNVPAPAFSRPDEFVTGRVAVSPDDWTLEFILKVAGAYRWLPYAFAAKRVLFGPRGATGGARPESAVESAREHTGVHPK